MAFIAIDKADPEIYKSLKDSLRQQYSVKQDNYPKILATAMEILNQNYKRKPKKQGSESGDKNEDQEVKSFAQKTKSGTKFWCFKCGRKECDPKNKDSCPMKDAEPTEWVAYKNMERNNQRSFAQQSEDASSVASNGSGITEASGTPSFQAFQFATFQFAEVNLKDDMSQVILLDTQSGKSLFCNPDFVTNIRDSEDHLLVHTNAGVLHVKQKATISNFQDVWFSRKAIANVISQAEVVDHPNYSVKYNDKDDIYRVYNRKTGNITRFPRKGGHYIYAPKSANMFVNTVDENKKMYTRQQYKRAIKARDLLYSLLAPTIKDLKYVVQSNSIKDNPVTEEDIKIAEDIFGPEVAVMKGRNTRSRPTPVTQDYIAVPKKLMKIHNNVHLFMDIMYVNELPFLTCISKNIMFRHAVSLKNTKSDEL